jgi:hypothetical protein
MKTSRLMLLVLTGSVCLAGPLWARTITLTAEDCDQMAIINPKAPRLSWAAYETVPGVYNSQPAMHWVQPMAILMRFPIDKHVPKGQRITKAELTISADYVAGKPQITVRRLVAQWGTGVCHQYRMTHPQKLEWAQPGGRGAATDRANKDTAIFKVPAAGAHTVDVTEDIELWYTGAAPNRGWILTKETDGDIIYMPSPYSPATAGAKTWKLQITFEPQ